MENKRKQIYLGALLHDIGKFYQRGDKGFSDKYNELSDFSKSIAEDICPVNEYGRFGYQHVIWTNEFFEKVKGKLEQLPGIKQNLYSETDINNVVNFACNHHKPQTKEQAFITIGDWWSAGIDRQTPIDDKDKNIEWGKGRYKSIPLYSVFNKVNKANYSSAFKLKQLSVKRDNIFPGEITNKQDGVSEGEYKQLWNLFIKEFEKLPTDDIDAFAESLLFLLKKYTWCIPSNTMDMADVSLYEHLKTTAAFADSIYMYEQENQEDFTFDKQKNRLGLKDKVYPVILVGGDVSGIQKFIYNIASSKAAKSLKGRSFYLQLLIDSIIQKIITHTDIEATKGHVLYSSGGKFYMILPNTDKVKNALSKILIEIEDELWQQHKGVLSVNLDFVAFAYRKNEIDIEKYNGKQLGDLWRTLAEKLNKQKHRKFKNILSEHYSRFFDESDAILKTGGDVEVCAVTGEEISTKQGVKLKGTDLLVTKAVNEQTELGTVLKDADYLITHKDQNKHKYLSSRSAKNSNLEVVGIYNYLFDQKQLTFDDADFRKISSADVSRVIKFNETNFLSATLKGNKVSYGFQFYGGNKQALLTREREKTFEDIAKNESGKQTYLGILRMDVDNLGNIFIKGLPDKDKSFAAYATLSFQLDLFFSGYLNTIRNSDEFKDWVNILYSGGDDIFAVGRWDKLIVFAERIRDEFEKFIGRNDISISGGISIVRNKFPIAKAAELAGEAEEQSKDFELNDKQKNAITFLGETVSWDTEFVEVKELKDEFSRLIGKGMSKGILHKIMEFAAAKKANDRHVRNNNTEKVDLSYKWNTAYYLKRFADRYKRNKEIQFFITDLQKKLFVTNRSYNLAALSARWAELELREINNQ